MASLKLNCQGSVSCLIVVLFLYYLVSKDQQKLESLDPSAKLSKIGSNPSSKSSKENIAKNLEIVRFKELATHELSVVSLVLLLLLFPNITQDSAYFNISLLSKQMSPHFCKVLKILLKSVR